jgi:hypothetical protein
MRRDGGHNLAVRIRTAGELGTLTIEQDRHCAGQVRAGEADSRAG